MAYFTDYFTGYFETEITLEGVGSAVGTSNAFALGPDFPLTALGVAGYATPYYEVQDKGSEAIESGAGESDGTSEVLAVGASNHAAVAAAEGAGEALAEGIATYAAAGTAEGAATVEAIGQSTASASGSADGIGAATGVGESTAEAVFSADGQATPEAVGEGIPEGFEAAEGLSEGTSTAAAVGEAVSERIQEEQASGGWANWIRYEQTLLRRKRERERLEDAVDEEIAALMRGEDAPKAEEAAAEYLDDLRALVAEAEADARFREFVAAITARDELAWLLAIDRAIREQIRRRRDEDDFLSLILLAA